AAGGELDRSEKRQFGQGAVLVEPHGDVIIKGRVGVLDPASDVTGDPWREGGQVRGGGGGDGQVVLVRVGQEAARDGFLAYSGGVSGQGVLAAQSAGLVGERGRSFGVLVHVW